MTDQELCETEREKGVCLWVGVVSECVFAGRKMGERREEKERTRTHTQVNTPAF